MDDRDKSRAATNAEQIDARFHQLVQEVDGDLARIVEAMSEYLPNLREIWSNATDEEIDLLFDQYPNFCSYCVVVDWLS